MIPRSPTSPEEWFKKTPSPYSGTNKIRVVLWWYFGAPIYRALPHPLNNLRISLLRAFGAKIGEHCFFDRLAKIWMPWKLSVGDHVGVSFNVLIYNFEEVTIGAYCSIATGVFINTASHDYKSRSFDYIFNQVSIAGGCFIGADVYISPGVRIGELAVVGARSVVTRDLPSRMVCVGHPCVPLKPRFNDEV